MVIQTNWLLEDAYFHIKEVQSLVYNIFKVKVVLRFILIMIMFSFPVEESQDHSHL